MKQSRPMFPPRAPARGFMLIEALVAIVIFTVGVLGIVGLQASMTKATSQSKMRADAAFLAQQLIGTMWADAANLDKYATGVACTGNARCSQWESLVASVLPGGTANVTVAVTVDALTLKVTKAEPTIRITWTPPGESAHSYSTQSTISVNL